MSLGNHPSGVATADNWHLHLCSYTLYAVQAVHIIVQDQALIGGIVGDWWWVQRVEVIPLPCDDILNSIEEVIEEVTLPHVYRAGNFVDCEPSAAAGRWNGHPWHGSVNCTEEIYVIGPVAVRLLLEVTVADRLGGNIWNVSVKLLPLADWLSRRRVWIETFKLDSCVELIFGNTYCWHKSSLVSMHWKYEDLALKGYALRR